MSRWGTIKRRLAGKADPALLKVLRDGVAETRRQTELLGELRSDLRGEAAQQIKTLRAIHWELKQQRTHLEGYSAFVAHPYHDELREFTDEHQLGYAETLRRVARDRLSLARFGDGELKTMLRPDYQLRFQPRSPGLVEELRAVLTLDGYDPERLLVGFPATIRDPHWNAVWLDLWPEVRQLVNRSVTYGNAHVSRPVFFRNFGTDGVRMWRDLWHDQDVVLITGEGSRTSLDPELFGNAKSSEVIHSVPVGAYEDLPRLKALLADSDPGKQYLIALGPAGTLLAAWLSTTGRWAIDIGHLPGSIAAALHGAPIPEATGTIHPPTR